MRQTAGLQITGIRMETRSAICQDRRTGMDIADRSPVPYRRIEDKNLNENFHKKTAVPVMGIAVFVLRGNSVPTFVE